MSTTTAGATADYLAEVRAELADLPATELEEVLDDVAGHLDEVARELAEVTAESLAARLGTPQQYAEELRAAAGYPPKTGTTSGGNRPAAALLLAATSTVLLPICAVWWLGSYTGLGGAIALGAIGLAPAMLSLWLLREQGPGAVTATALWRSVAGRLDRMTGALPAGLRRDLVTVGQPGWWLLRGAIAGALLGVLLGRRETTVIGLAALTGMIASVWLSRRSQRDRRWLWFLIPANAVALVALAIGPSSGAYWSIGALRGYDSTYTSQPVATAVSGLARDGRPVSNVFPFDQQGRLISNVRLYDESGRPLNVGYERCVPAPNGGTTWLKDNVYPKATATVSPDSGSCKETATPPLVVPPLKSQR